MARLQNALVIAEAVIAVLLMAGVLIQTPKASGLGGTIGRRGRSWRRVPHEARPRAPDLLDDVGPGRRFPDLLHRQRLGDDAFQAVAFLPPRLRRPWHWSRASPSPRYRSRLAAAQPWKHWSANPRSSIPCLRPTTAPATSTA